MYQIYFLVKSQELNINSKFKICPICTSNSPINEIYCVACDHNFNKFVDNDGR
jgi:hypothetical protein